MKKFRSITGGCFHLEGNDIDTDRIIPARYLKCVTFEGLGDNVFKDDRIQLNGAHPFDDPKNRTRTILLVDENFGSGSSREHAVPALTQWGIQVIIGRSFAEIFRGNAVGNGLVCVTVDEVGHRKIATLLREGAFYVQVDIESLKIVVGVDPEGSIDCNMPTSHREKLMAGTWDDIATCLDAGDLIHATASRLPYFRSQVVSVPDSTRIFVGTIA